MQEDFYIVLLSNSSQSYFPENKSTHFVTKLPKHINLQGDWAVALIDIHVPLNFQNVPKEEESRCMIYERINKYSQTSIIRTPVIRKPGYFEANIDPRPKTPVFVCIIRRKFTRIIRTKNFMKNPYKSLFLKFTPVIRRRYFHVYPCKSSCLKFTSAIRRKYLYKHNKIALIGGNVICIFGNSLVCYLQWPSTRA